MMFPRPKMVAMVLASYLGGTGIGGCSDDPGTRSADSGHETQAQHVRQTGSAGPKLPPRPASVQPLNTPGDPARRDQLFAEAQQLVGARQLGTAIERLEQALQVGPEDGPTRLLLGVCRSTDQGDVRGARRELLRARELAPGSPSPPYMLAKLALATDEPEEAGLWVDEALALDPDHGPSQVIKAQLLRQRGELEPALALLDQHLQNHEGSAASLYERGFIHMRAGHHEQAVADFDRVLALDATVPKVHFNRAKSLTKLGRTEQAAEAMVDFELLNPIFSPSQNDQEPDLDKRQGLLRKICGRFPGMWQAYLMLAEVQTTSSGPQAAADTLREAVRRYPDATQVRAALVAALEQAGDHDGAQRERAALQTLLTDRAGKHE